MLFDFDLRVIFYFVFSSPRCFELSCLCLILLLGFFFFLRFTHVIYCMILFLGFKDCKFIC